MRRRRRRGIHVLMGTLALVAGCSTAQRAEVSGVVRDRATGRVIAGARVVGTDGSLAETDADGRFRLYVNGAYADVRISAAGHSSEHVEIEGLDARVELAPIDETWGAVDLGTGDDGAHVVGFVEDVWALDAGTIGDASVSPSCAETSLAQAHSAIGCASCHGAGDAASQCSVCHATEARALRGAMPSATIAPHAALGDRGDGCLACHAERVARGDATRSCARCHGTEAAIRTTELHRFFALATTHASDHAGTTFEMTRTSGTTVHETISTWATALARDRSGGAHDPRTLRAVAEALAE